MEPASSAGHTETVTVLLEADYGLTDRLSATLGLPYIFAKYTDGPFPPFLPPATPTDSCRCWHSTFQDFSLAARYRLGDDPWAITPLVRYINPSHDYNYQAEAVVGFDRREFAVGVDASLRLAGLLPKASIEAGYTYSFVERFLGIPNDRSNGTVEIEYAVTRRLHIQATGTWQQTHGGLRLGSPSGDPFYPPGELSILNTPDEPRRVPSPLSQQLLAGRRRALVLGRTVRRLRLVHEVRLGNRHARRAGLHRRSDVVFRWRQVTRTPASAILVDGLRPALNRPRRPGRGS